MTREAVKQCYNDETGSHDLDLVILPEFLLGSPHQEDPSHFVDFHDPFTSKESVVFQFQQLAKELKVCIVPGSIPRPMKSDESTIENKEQYLNTSYFIDREGKILGLYNKKNIWISERPKFSVATDEHIEQRKATGGHADSQGVSAPLGDLSKYDGNKDGKQYHRVFETEFGKTAILICWDVIFSEAFKQLAQQDVDLIIIPSFWTGDDNLLPGQEKENKDSAVLTAPADSEAVLLKHALVTRAFESEALVAYANVGGKPSEGYIGLSQVAMPLWGNIPGTVYDVKNTEQDSLELEKLPEPSTILDVKESSPNRIQIVQVDQWKEKLELSEKIYQIRSDMKRSNWHYPTCY